ncbi:hypothetical protein K492DRAFT_174534, partial [Lichtheimia hyalospora FSU 10163]
QELISRKPCMVSCLAIILQQNSANNMEIELVWAKNAVDQSGKGKVFSVWFLHARCHCFQSVLPKGRRNVP